MCSSDLGDGPGADDQGRHRKGQADFEQFHHDILLPRMAGGYAFLVAPAGAEFWPKYASTEARSARARPSWCWAIVNSFSS